MASDVIKNIVIKYSAMTDSFNRQIDETTGFIENNQKAIATLGTAFAGLGIAITGSLGMASAKSMQFNSEMANVSTMLSGGAARTNELKIECRIWQFR